MKNTIMLAFMAFTLLTANNSYANAFYSKIHPYMQISTGEVLQLSEFDFDKNNTTITYYSYLHGKKLTISVDDISKSTTSEIAGVKAGELVLIQGPAGLVTCSVYNLFENTMARIGCQTGKITGRLGPDRRVLSSATLLTVDQAGVIAEVDSINNISKLDQGSLTADAGTLKAGTKVRIEAVFANGDAVVQKLGLNILDTESLLMKKAVEKINLNDFKLD